MSSRWEPNNFLTLKLAAKTAFKFARRKVRAVVQLSETMYKLTTYSCRLFPLVFRGLLLQKSSNLGILSRYMLLKEIIRVY